MLAMLSTQSNILNQLLNKKLLYNQLPNNKLGKYVKK